MPNVTTLATAGYMKGEAERQAVAAVNAQNTAVIAAAELVRQMRIGVYQHIAANRHGLIREEVAEAFPAGELVDVLLAALVSDGEVVERGGVFTVPQVAA